MTQLPLDEVLYLEYYKVRTRTLVEDNNKIEQLKEYIRGRLDKFKEFKEIYGKDFVDKRLEKFENVYIAEENNEDSGYQEHNNITVCIRKDKNELKIKNDEEKYGHIVLHEMIHFLLRRNEYCSGIIKKIEADTTKGKEEWIVGRGLNEGLTDWIAEKCGLSNELSSYNDLTNIIKKLELALGTKRVLKLGKGKNIEKNLKMNKLESYTLLSKCDRVCSLISKIRLFEEIISGLSTENKEKYEFAKQDIEKIKSSKEYYDFLNENNLEDSSNNLLDYCKKHKKQLEDNYNEILFDIDEQLLEKYFKKDVEKADRQDRLSSKMLKLCKLLFKEDGESIDSENSKNRNKLLSIPERLREKEQRYLSLMNEDKLEYKHLFYAYNQIAYLGKTQVNKFLEYIDKMNFSKSDTMIALIRFLESYNKKKDYNKISVKKFSTDENEDKYYIYNIDGKEMSDKGESQNVKVDDEEINYNKILNFTIKLEEDFKKIVNEFNEIIVQGYIARNPSAKVKILNRIIILETEEEKQYYIIDNGIKKAILEEEVDLKNNKITNIISKIKERKNRIIKSLLKDKHKKLPEKAQIEKRNEGISTNLAEKWREQQRVTLNNSSKQASTNKKVNITNRTNEEERTY